MPKYRQDDDSKLQVEKLARVLLYHDITCSPPVPRLNHDITCSPPVPDCITCFPPVPRLYHVRHYALLIATFAIALNSTFNSTFVNTSMENKLTYDYFYSH